MLPHEREMVERLSDEPFTLLGINSDKSRSALEKVLKDENITWPNIYGGPTHDNPIAKQYNVSGWPTIYILDHEGVIRHKNLRDEQMEEAVVKLIKEIKGGKAAKAGKGSARETAKAKKPAKEPAKKKSIEGEDDDRAEDDPGAR